MDSEKATAVSPGSSLSAPRRSVLDLLQRAAMTPAATSQARRINRDQKTIKSRRKEKRQETGQFSLPAPRRVDARAYVRTQS